MQENKNVFCDSHVIVKEIGHNNRGLFAQKEFRPWDIVLKVQPISISIMSAMKDKFCNYCLQEKELVRCSQCKFMYYCSTECQKIDWKIHKYECKIYSKMVNEKGLSPLKNITAEFALNLRLHILRQKDQDVNEKIKQMVELLEFQPAEKIHYFQELSTILLENGELQKNQQNMSSLMRQISTISLNGFTIQDYMCSFDAIGPGLYYPANFINHDCHPNCTQIYDGRVLKIVANQPISKNDEITISYTPVLDDYEKKKKVCRDGYLFQCFCQFCQVNKMFDWSIFYLLCPKCKTKSLSNQSLPEQKEDENKKISKKKIVCGSCKEILTIESYRKIMDEIQNLSEKIGKKGTSYGEGKKCFFRLKKIVDFSSPQFQPILHQIYIKAIEEGGQNPKMYEQAYIFLKQMISNMPKWFRLDEAEQIPYSYIWKFAEMGKLCYNLNKKKKAVQFTEKAFDVLKKLGFKNNLRQVKEMEQRMNELKISMSFEKAQAFRK